jgi:hypothetical protein
LGRGTEFFEQGLGLGGETVASAPLPSEPRDKPDESEHRPVEGQHEKNQGVFSGGESMGTLAERISAQGGKDHEDWSGERLRRIGIM